MQTFNGKNNIGVRSLPLRSAVGVFVAAALTEGCAAGGSPSSPTGGTNTTTTPTTPASNASRLELPGEYYLDAVRTCSSIAAAGCGGAGRPVPAALFSISSTGVVLYQMSAFLRFNTDGTFEYQSVQRTDSQLGQGPALSTVWGGGFIVSDSQITFRSFPNQVAPSNITINTDGTLTRFYNIPIEVPFTPQIIQVAETYRTVN